jgi:hypothetical protein
VREDVLDGKGIFLVTEQAEKNTIPTNRHTIFILPSYDVSY